MNAAWVHLLIVAQTGTATSSRLDSAAISDAVATATVPGSVDRGPFSPWISPPLGTRCDGYVNLIVTRDEPLGEICADLQRYLEGVTAAGDAERLLGETTFFRSIRCGREPRTSRLWCVADPEAIVVESDVEGTMPFTLLKEDLSRRMYLRSGTLLADPATALPKQAARLRDHLGREGFFAPTVSIESSTTGGAAPNRGVGLTAHVIAGEDTVLRDIQVLGDPVLTEDDLDDLRHHWIFGWFPMRFRPITLEDDLEALTERLKERGYPEATINERFSPDPARNATDLVLEVRAGPRLELVFAGNSVIDDEDLGDVATFAKAGALDQVEVDRTAAAIKTAYQKEGYWKVALTSQVESANDNTTRVIYTITEGTPATISRITLSGNDAVPNELIFDQVDFLTEPRALLVSGVWVDAWAESDAAQIRDRFRRRGYSAAEVRPEATLLPDSTLEARFVIVEGPRRTVGEMNIRGLPAEIDATALLAALKLKGGAPYVEEELGGDRREMLVRLAAAGYPRAEVSRKLSLPSMETGGKVRINYTVEPGPRSIFGGLLIRGNFLTARSVLERQLSLEKGEPLDLEALGEAKRRLRNLGIFGSIDLKPLGQWQNDQETWLLLELEERNRQTLDLVLSFSTADFFSAGFDYRDRNFLGRAIALDLELRFANASELGSKDIYIGERDELQLKLHAPRPLNLPFDIEGRGYYSFENRTAYDERRVGASFAAFRPLLTRDSCEGCPDIIISLGYELVASKLTLMSPAECLRGETSVFCDPPATIGRLVPRVFIDRRDSFVDPRQGYAADLRFELANRFFAGPFYDDGRDFWRALTNFQLYVTAGVLFERRFEDGSALGGPLVIALGARYGVAHPYGPKDEAVQPVPAAETFYYGGDLSVRGLSQGASRSALPGATYLLVTNLELRFYILQDFGFGSIQIAGFTDLGVVSYHLGDLLDQPTISVGPALRYVTPIGPLTLAYGWPIVRAAPIVERVPDQIPATGTIHFAFGYAF